MLTQVAPTIPTSKSGVGLGLKGKRGLKVGPTREKAPRSIPFVRRQLKTCNGFSPAINWLVYILHQQASFTGRKKLLRTLRGSRSYALRGNLRLVLVFLTTYNFSLKSHFFIKLIEQAESSLFKHGA